MLTLHAINLPHRTDRAKRLQEIEAAVPGIHFELFPAIKLPRAWIGCHLSHQAIVFEARLRKEPYVIVVEDDIEFVPGFHYEHLLDKIELADSAAFDCLHGGTVSYADKIGGIFTSVYDIGMHTAHPVRIVQTEQYMSTQLVVYFARGYEKYLRLPFGHGIDFNANAVATPPEHYVEPPDAFKRGLTVPFLAIQRDDFSDNEGRHLKLADAWRDAEQSWKNAIQLGTHRT